MTYSNHVLLRNPLRDTNNKFHFCIDSLIYRCCSVWCRNINDRCCCSCGFFCLSNHKSIQFWNCRLVIMKKFWTWICVSRHVVSIVWLCITSESVTSFTVLKTGRLRCLVPPFPGDTPPTNLVPYSNACWLWNVP